MRAKRAEEELKATTAAKEAIEKLQQAGVAKLAVHERQLKTFFEANEALEADLLKQVQRAAAPERRKVELEAEQQTIEVLPGAARRDAGAVNLTLTLILTLIPTLTLNLNAGAVRPATHRGRGREERRARRGHPRRPREGGAAQEPSSRRRPGMTLQRLNLGQ